MTIRKITKEEYGTIISIDNIFKRYDSNPRDELLELLYITADNKPGAVMNFQEKMFEELLPLLVSLKNSDTFDFKTKKLDTAVKCVFYNPKQVQNQSVIERILKDTADYTDFNMFIGAPECCSKYSHIYGYTAIATKHKWCSPNCKESKKLEEDCIKTVLLNTPELADILFYQQTDTIKEELIELIARLQKELTNFRPS